MIDKECKAIVELWNEFSPLKQAIDDRYELYIQPTILRKVLQYDYEMVIEAINNYRTALELKDSQAWKHKITTFFKMHIDDYMEHNFNVENYKKSNFTKEVKREYKPRVNRSRAS